MFGDEPPMPPVLPDSPPAIVRTAEDIPPPPLPANVILTRVARTAAATEVDNAPRPSIVPEMNRASATTSTDGVTGELVRRPGFRGYDLVNQDGVMIGAGLFKDQDRARNEDHRLSPMGGQPRARTSGLGLNIQIRLGGN